MATLTRTMTYAQLLTAISNSSLNIGEGITVSDKGWFLNALSINTLYSPMPLTIDMGDVIPSAIFAKIVEMKTPIYMGDGINNITIPTGYQIIDCYASSNANGYVYQDGIGIYAFSAEYFKATELRPLNGIMNAITVNGEWEDNEPEYQVTFVLYKYNV